MNISEIFYILEKDWYKLQAWATLAHEEDKNEISGLMTAVPQKDGRFLISDVDILKQENTASNTELDGDAVSAYMMKYGMKYNNPKMKFVWWHSHHTMSAFWSGTDIKEIEAWENNSFSLALVINLREEYVFRVSCWKSNGLPMTQHIDTTLTIERKSPKISITNPMKEQYKELCSKPVYNNVRHYGGYNVNNQQHLNLWNKAYQGEIVQNEKELEIEQAYSEVLEKVEEIQDSFSNGTLGFNEYHKLVKKINKQIKKHSAKLPFRLIVFKEDKVKLLELMMCKMPDELFEWDDNSIKDTIETNNWNNSFGVNRWT